MAYQQVFAARNPVMSVCRRAGYPNCVIVLVTDPHSPYMESVFHIALVYTCFSPVGVSSRPTFRLHPLVAAALMNPSIDRAGGKLTEGQPASSK